MKLPSLEAVRAEQARRSLAAFIRHGWHVLEPTAALDWNWHIDAIAAHLQAATEGWIAKQRDPAAEQLIQNLVVNVPPGTAKSRIVSVLWPAWVWTRWPAFRWIFLSSNPRVALRDSVYCRDVVTSPWYQSWFDPAWKLRDDDNAKGKFANSAGGYRSAFGFSSRITGDRADAIVWDDPHDAEEVHSDALRLEVIDRWDNAIGNRVNDLRCSLRVGIMQRLHEADLTGHVLKQGGWEHLRIPMEYDPAPLCECPSCQKGETRIGWRDPRSREGELLFPQRFPREVLTAEKVRLGESGYAGQMQQRPVPAGGTVFKRWHWRYWHPADRPAPAPVRVKMPEDYGGGYREVPSLPVDVSALRDWLQSWDMSFVDTSTADYVAGQAWGRRDASSADVFLVDQVHDRMDFSATCRAFMAFSEKHPQIGTKLVENKANGPAVISALRSKIGGLVAVEPQGGKVARANAAQPFQEAGNVYVPHPDYAPWVLGFLAECDAFPNGANDDRVDAFTQMAARWLVKPGRALPRMVQRGR